MGHVSCPVQVVRRIPERGGRGPLSPSHSVPAATAVGVTCGSWHNRAPRSILPQLAKDSAWLVCILANVVGTSVRRKSVTLRTQESNPAGAPLRGGEGAQLKGKGLLLLAFFKPVCSEAHGGAGYTFGALTILVVLPPGRKPRRAQLSQKRAGHRLCHAPPLPVAGPALGHSLAA